MTFVNDNQILFSNAAECTHYLEGLAATRIVTFSSQTPNMPVFLQSHTVQSLQRQAKKHNSLPQGPEWQGNLPVFVVSTATALDKQQSHYNDGSDVQWQIHNRQLKI
jgi:hypothetical protein